MSKQIDLGVVLVMHKGDWDNTTTYERLNIVRHSSAAWICAVDESKGEEPSNTSTHWKVLVRDTSSVSSVNGKRGDVIVDTVDTPAANDSSDKIANTEWVTAKTTSVLASAVSYADTAAANAVSGIREIAALDAKAVVDTALENHTQSSDLKYATKTTVETEIAAAKEYTDTAISTKVNSSDVVMLDGAQTIAGSKTFISPIVGSITGNAATATKSTQDGDGNVITSTYLTKTEASSNYLGKTAKASSATTADSATKATQDASGNVITTTYATKANLAVVEAIADAALPASKITYGTEDLEEGVSALPTGTLYFVYEA